MGGRARRYLPRQLWTVLGAISLGLGVVGIALPLLPTTPFLILAAYCFSRGSRKLQMWLLNHAYFGPPIRNWREHRAISAGAKRSALLAIVLVFLLSLLLGAPGWVLAAQAVILVSVAVFLVTRPSPPESAG